MSFDPASFLPQGAQYGGNMVAMQKGFEQKQAGANYAQQMGGAAGIMGGIGDLAGTVTKSVGQIQQGKQLKSQGLVAAGRVKQAQSGIDMAASAAQMGGPIGMAIAMPLKLISALMNIEGPRQKRQKRQLEQRNRVKAKHASMRANAASAGLRMAGGALRTGASIGPTATVADPTAPVQSFTPLTTPNV